MVLRSTLNKMVQLLFIIMIKLNNKAVELIEKIVKKAQVGEVYDGKVVRVEDNYAFINLFDGTDGFFAYL